MSSKLFEFSRNVLFKSFVEFYLLYNSFYLRRLRPVLQNLGNAPFWPILAKIGGFSIFRSDQNCFPTKFVFEKFLSSDENKGTKALKMNLIETRLLFVHL